MHMLPRHYEIIENADTVQTYSDHLRKIYVGLRTTSLGLLRASRTTGSFVEREVLAMMIESRDMKSSSPETLRRDLLCECSWGKELVGFVVSVAGYMEQLPASGLALETVLEVAWARAQCSPVWHC
jgi:hypothetical protein